MASLPALRCSWSANATAAFWLACLAMTLILPETLLRGADLGWWGSVVWRPRAYQYGGFWAGLLHGWRPNYTGQPAAMFVSYSFLHAGPGHLLGNLAALAWLGPLVASRAGAGGLMMIWGAAVLGGAAAFGLLSRQVAPMVGASGALFGLAGAWLVWSLAEARTAGLAPRLVILRAAAAVAGLALLNFVAWWLQGGQLAWQTHLGGFLAGTAVAGARRPGC